MKKRRLFIWLLILSVSILASACGSSPDADLADFASPLEESSSGEQVNQALQGLFNFEMAATVNGLVADLAYDQLESEWVGEFSVDSEGLFTGVGNVTYDALIFAVDEELCGYAWTELGDVAFQISGRVHNQGGDVAYPLKLFLLDVKRNSLSEPEPTCEDPQGFLAKMPDQYIEIHRDALLSTVLTHLHQNVGNQIRLQETFTGQSGTVDYTILVSLAAVDLE